MAAPRLKRMKKAFEQAWRVVRFRKYRKIVIGASKRWEKGWLATEKHTLDVTDRAAFACYWSPNSRQAFFAEHVWEHLDERESVRANANCFEFLRPGGRLRLAVPDGLHPDPAYIESVRPGGTGHGAVTHKVLYDYRSLSGALERAGFRVEILEYWDESGRFHSRDWSPEYGHVLRSRLNDPRNRNESHRYTSLIIDAIKP
jgi:predicted SAM-dependent methyltransferase